MLVVEMVLNEVFFSSLVVLWNVSSFVVVDNLVWLFFMYLILI